MPLDDRFYDLVRVVNASNTQTPTSATSTDAAEITGSSVSLEFMQAREGLTFEWEVAGTKTGANAAHVINLMSNLSSTPLMTLTADDATAVDWVAKFTMRCGGGATQKIMGVMSSNTTDCECDYAAGTAALAASGARLYLTFAAGNSSDTATVEMCIVKSWVK